MSDPGPHPEPPSDFDRVTLPIITQGGSLFRTHPHTAPPFYFGCIRARFGPGDCTFPGDTSWDRPCAFRGLSNLAKSRLGDSRQKAIVYPTQRIAKKNRALFISGKVGVRSYGCGRITCA